MRSAERERRERNREKEKRKREKERAPKCVLLVCGILATVAGAGSVEHAYGHDAI